MLLYERRMPIQLFRRAAPFLFWAALLFAYVCAIMPAQEAPKFSSSDKVEHMVAFLTLAILAAFAFPKATVLKVGIWLAVFGAFIEFSQAVPALHRDASVYDWVADVAAICVGLLIVRPLRRIGSA